jgi:hypothetical protein
LTLLGIAMIVSGRMTGEPPTGRSSAGRGPARVSVPCGWAAARRSRTSFYGFGVETNPIQVIVNSVKAAFAS